MRVEVYTGRGVRREGVNDNALWGTDLFVFSSLLSLLSSACFSSVALLAFLLIDDQLRSSGEYLFWVEEL